MFKVSSKIIDLSKPDILTIDAIIDNKYLSMVSDVSGVNVVVAKSLVRTSICMGKSVIWDAGEIIKSIP